MSIKTPKTPATTYRRSLSKLNLHELSYAVGMALQMKCFDLEHNWPGNNTVNGLAAEEPVVAVDLRGHVGIEHAGVSREFAPYKGSEFMLAMMKGIDGLQIDCGATSYLVRVSAHDVKRPHHPFVFDSENKDDLPLLLAKALVRVRLGQMITLPLGLKSSYPRS